MTGNTKRKILTLLGLVTLITVMIAASLPQLELRPGLPLPRVQEGQVVAAQPAGAGAVSLVSISVNRFVLVPMALLLAGTILYALYKALRGADWKSILAIFRPMLVTGALLIAFILLTLLIPTSAKNDLPLALPVATPEPVVTSPLGSVPDPLLWLVGIGLLVSSLLVGLWIFTSSRQARPLDLVGREAEKARQALRTGAGLKDVIIHCYIQMSLAVKQERGIEREAFMTTGEFERVLTATGIPHEPIHQLTRLFEAVRYGNWRSSAAEEQTAIQCLDQIVFYSRDAKGREMK